ncbi:hypothetical protein D3C87_1621460 [compost metagenome]
MEHNGSKLFRHTEMPTRTLRKMGSRTLRFRCEPCGRKGQYRADRLAEIVGDVPLAQAMTLLAKPVGCPRALNPPSPNSLNYNVDRCQIRRDDPAPPIPATVGKAMHEKWRGFIRCGRHHQGLKATKPCGVEAGLDLPTLVAALGYDFEIVKLKSKLSAPCCGSRSFVHGPLAYS